MRLAARGRRSHRPPGDPLRARVRGGHARRRPAVRRGRRAGRDGRRDRAAHRAAHELGARQRRRQPAHDARRRRAARRSFAPTWRCTRASRPSATSAPPSSPTSSAIGMHATAVSDVERAPRERLRELQLERLRGLVARLLDAVPLTRERLHAAGVRSGEDVRSLDDLRRLPFSTKADLREHYPFGLLAVPREEVVRVHASSGTGGKPTVVGYTRARPRHVDRRDGALPGHGRRARRDARAQRQRLRALHRRARASTRAPSGWARRSCPCRAASPSARSRCCTTCAPRSSSPRRPTPCTSASALAERGLGPDDLALEVGRLRRRAVDRGHGRRDRARAGPDGREHVRALGDDRARRGRPVPRGAGGIARQRGPLPRRGRRSRDRRAAARRRRGRARLQHADQGGAAAAALPHRRHRLAGPPPRARAGARWRA